MSSQTLGLRLLLGVALIGCVGDALAQQTRTMPSFTSMIDIDALIDNHVRFLARKYDLTEEQESYTLEFLHQKADQFLAQHREELFSVADRLFEVRGGGEISQEELALWGQRALPLYEEAKNLIIQGNNEWRAILTDEQRAVHDEDLRQMYESFADTEDQLARIVSGEMTVEEFRRGPRARRSRPQAARPNIQPNAPAANSEGRVSERPVTRSRQRLRKPAGTSNPQAAERRRESSAHASNTVRERMERLRNRRTVAQSKGSTDFEGDWERYVREFIEKYELDEGQTQRALMILKDCQEQARNYMKRHKSNLERLETKMKELGGKKESLDDLKRVTERRQKLLEPIQQIFEKRLKPRLEKLPTRTQRAAADSGKRKTPTVRPTPRPTREPQREPEREPEEEHEPPEEEDQ